MKEIPLTRGYVALVDDADYAVLASSTWHAHVPPRRGLVYARRVPGHGKTELMHRVILEVTDPKIHVDHRDGNGLNNVRANLRVATRTQNTANARKRKDGRTSRFRGVSRFEKVRRDGSLLVRWHACVSGQSPIRVGSFHTELGAAAAYNASAHRRYGEFARLNNLSS